jgi:hypothetical protein
MKPRSLVLAIVLICAANGAAAQTREVQLFEGGVSAGVMFPSVNLYDYAGYPGGQVSAELRFNINPKFDVGAQLSMSRFKQEDSYYGVGSVVMMSPSVIGDYNWRLSEIMNIFVGAGFGLAFDFAGDDVGYADGLSLEAFPRVGIELYDRVRLTADYRINFSAAGYVGFTIGYVFGGRPK